MILAEAEVWLGPSVLLRIMSDGLVVADMVGLGNEDELIIR